jgi:hypothetical protein
VIYRPTIQSAPDSSKVALDDPKLFISTSKLNSTEYSAVQYSTYDHTVLKIKKPWSVKRALTFQFFDKNLV